MHNYGFEVSRVIRFFWHVMIGQRVPLIPLCLLHDHSPFFKHLWEWVCYHYTQYMGPMALCITYPLTMRPVFSPFSLILDFFHFVSVVLCEMVLILPFHSNCTHGRVEYLYLSGYIQLTFHSFLMEFPVRKVSDLLEQCLPNFQVVSGDRVVAEIAD